ncbi:unnamed protein product [Polarella glacialis]|uniref:Uncharacterized protein n=1 Tax=Polarella glacialis TaxID=89957 RepID=A0A813G3H6_POLGL|nr:unnamed protein product [Polarella glacialis]
MRPQDTRWLLFPVASAAAIACLVAAPQRERLLASVPALWQVSQGADPLPNEAEELFRIEVEESVLRLFDKIEARRTVYDVWAVRFMAAMPLVFLGYLLAAT